MVDLFFKQFSARLSTLGDLLGVFICVEVGLGFDNNDLSRFDEEQLYIDLKQSVHSLTQAIQNISFLLNVSYIVHNIILMQIETLEAVKRALVDDRPKDFQSCVAFARSLWQDHYSNTIRQLLFNFPSDQVCFEKGFIQFHLYVHV